VTVVLFYFLIEPRIRETRELREMQVGCVCSCVLD
jgi:hypothetical protein